MGFRSPFKNEFPPAKVTPEGIRGNVEVVRPLTESVQSLESEMLRKGATDPAQTLFNISLTQGTFFAPNTGMLGSDGRSLVEAVAKQRAGQEDKGLVLADRVDNLVQQLQRNAGEMGLFSLTDVKKQSTSTLAPKGRKASEVSMDRFKAAMIPDLFELAESGQEVSDETIRKLIASRVLHRAQARKRKTPAPEEMTDTFRETMDEALRSIQRR